MATMAVISGKIVIQVSSAILYGGGGTRPGWPDSVNQVSRPVTNLVRMGPIAWLGSFEPGGVLVGVEPGAQMLGAVEAIDGAVFAGGRALRAGRPRPRDGRGTRLPRR